MSAELRVPGAELGAVSALSTQHSKLLKDALREAAVTLQQAGVESAALDARLLMQHALGISREQLLLAMDKTLSAEEEAAFAALIAERARRRPVSHLTGVREFWGAEFKVTADTLDPRPDSETLIEAVLQNVADKARACRILDLGTGTGCLLLSLLKELPEASGLGVDQSEAALQVAKENALRLGLQTRTTFLASHWCDKVEERFDIVVANPPYIPSRTIETLSPEVARYEPKSALDGGEDGLDCYRQIVAQLPRVMQDDGLAVLEIGIHQQEALAGLAKAQGLRVAAVRNDLGGIPRAVVLAKQ